MALNRIADFESLIVTASWIIQQNMACRWIVAYHDRSIEYYIGDMLTAWGLTARPIGDTLCIDGGALEIVQAMRPVDDPEEWPEQLQSDIHLIEIYRI